MESTTPDNALPPVDVAASAEPTQTSEKRITAQDAEQAKTEKEAAFSKLMDDMEDSVTEQGQYFVKLGGKTDAEDTRVLMLLMSDYGAGGRETHTLVTRKGLFSLTPFEAGSFSGNLNKILSALKKGEQPLDTSGLQDFGNGDEIRFGIQDGEKLDIKIGAFGLKPSTLTDEGFLRIVKNSIYVAESPHKYVVEGAKQQAAIAESASSMIRTLPPRE